MSFVGNVTWCNGFQGFPTRTVEMWLGVMVYHHFPRVSLSFLGNVTWCNGFPRFSNSHCGNVTWCNGFPLFSASFLGDSRKCDLVSTFFKGFQMFSEFRKSSNTWSRTRVERVVGCCRALWHSYNAHNPCSAPRFPHFPDSGNSEDLPKMSTNNHFKHYNRFFLVHWGGRRGDLLYNV